MQSSINVSSLSVSYHRPRSAAPNTRNCLELWVKMINNEESRGKLLVSWFLLDFAQCHDKQICLEPAGLVNILMNFLTPVFCKQNKILLILLLPERHLEHQLPKKLIRVEYQVAFVDL